MHLATGYLATYMVRPRMCHIWVEPRLIATVLKVRLQKRNVTKEHASQVFPLKFGDEDCAQLVSLSLHQVEEMSFLEAT